MRTKWVITQLISFAVFLGLLAIQGIGVGNSCDSDFLEFGQNVPPNYLEFKYWGTVGWVLGVVAAGLFIGALKFGIASNEFERLPSENAEAPFPSFECDR